MGRYLSDAFFEPILNRGKAISHSAGVGRSSRELQASNVAALSIERAIAPAFILILLGQWPTQTRPPCPHPGAEESGRDLIEGPLGHCGTRWFGFRSLAYGCFVPGTNPALHLTGLHPADERLSCFEH
jgi:hypothetical protein